MVLKKEVDKDKRLNLTHSLQTIKVVEKLDIFLKLIHGSSGKGLYVEFESSACHSWHH